MVAKLTRPFEMAAHASVEAAVGLAGSQAAYRWSVCFSAALIRFRQHFSGDLDQFLIYLIVAMGDLEHRAAGTAMKGINGLSISDITRIPRETTRRKLQDLAATGHIRAGEDGLWYLNDSGSDFSGEFERFFEQTKCLVQGC